MKKLLAFSLAVMLTISAIYAPLSVSAENLDYKLGDELITNGDFSSSTVNTTLTSICGYNAYTIEQYVARTPDYYYKWARPTGGLGVAPDAYANETTTPDASGEYFIYLKPAKRN